MPDRYEHVWAAARPYLRARKNDVHVPLSYGYAEALLAGASRTRTRTSCCRP